MQIHFYKYQGTGNDFIIIDNRMNVFNRSNTALVAKLCDRRFGIGADGLMLLQSKAGYDFEMVYYNSDGNESSMCGNGGRCIVEFARTLGLVKEKAFFIAIDGEHHANVQPGFISLKMKDVSSVELNADFAYLNTGSPHYVQFVTNVEMFPVFEEGKKVRYNERFKKEGTNVNFIEKCENALFVRTYERGVEGETYSCGTGVTAAAIVAAIKGVSTSQNECEIKTLGGNLKVKFNRTSNNSFSDVWLEGPATFVFEGNI
ncbi:MAG: diaminopimelate epimerase [Bacteroidetes bacterium]|nr:diaminopimelate epimerase [Bacteroidota bacterium]